MDKLKRVLLSRAFLRPLIGVVAGGLLGYLFYLLVGCSSGTCSITSTPLGSTIIGALFGLFVTSSPCSRGKCWFAYFI